MLFAACCLLFAVRFVLLVMVCLLFVDRRRIVLFDAVWCVFCLLLSVVRWFMFASGCSSFVVGLSLCVAYGLFRVGCCVLLFDVCVISAGCCSLLIVNYELSTAGV